MFSLKGIGSVKKATFKCWKILSLKCDDSGVENGIGRKSYALLLFVSWVMSVL